LIQAPSSASRSHPKSGIRVGDDVPAPTAEPSTVAPKVFVKRAACPDEVIASARTRCWAQADGAISADRAAQIARHVKRALDRADSRQAA
jgi:hypothetical protein